jgi:hypothetical protein
MARRPVSRSRQVGLLHRRSPCTGSHPKNALEVKPASISRYLTAKEEAARVAVERYGSPRDRTLIVFDLHTGLRS